jgi:hypothetical protein
MYCCRSGGTEKFMLCDMMDEAWIELKCEEMCNAC